MSDSASIILLVDPDTRARTLLARHIDAGGYRIMEASDGATALRAVQELDIRLVMTELYLRTGDDECLIHAIRRNKAHRRTRIAAHTQRHLPADREWAMRAGADAFLVKPTRAERLRYVVSQLTAARTPNSSVTATTASPMARRDTLNAALTDIEKGKLPRTSVIVFARSWWDSLPAAQRADYQRRAESVQVTLRSDSMLGNHFVEVRGGSRDDAGLSTERSESAVTA